MIQYLTIGAVVVLVLLYVLIFTNAITFIKLHANATKTTTLTDEPRVDALLQHFGLYLVHEVAKSPFQSNNALVESYYDCFGRAIVIKIRWTSKSYYYANPAWLDVLDKLYPTSSNVPDAVEE